MIFVVLGTQDKQFTRLLEAVDREIEKGTIKERVVVQAGQTKYESKNMEIFDLLPSPEFSRLMDEADLIITHGGAGTILTGIKKGKKIIAAARLAKYKEHHNDHQKQIIGEFASKGYILELRDFNKLGTMIQKMKNFKPKRFESNTQNMIKLIDDYIQDSDHTSWYHKYKEGLLYLFFGGCTTLVNIISFMILRFFQIDTYVSNALAWVFAVLFAFITNKLFVFESRGKGAKKAFKEGVSFFAFRLLSLLFDMGIMYLLIDIINCPELVSKIISNIFVIIINYVFSKLFIFKK
ncbi:MAG: GtrA family protein [Bacilli bacterium]|nr:GtrA family protein [Bacilli bacterium]